jgi:hypothetical protein
VPLFLGAPPQCNSRTDAPSNRIVGLSSGQLSAGKLLWLAPVKAALRQAPVCCHASAARVGHRPRHAKSCDQALRAFLDLMASKAAAARAQVGARGASPLTRRPSSEAAREAGGGQGGACTSTTLGAAAGVARSTRRYGCVAFSNVEALLEGSHPKGGPLVHQRCWRNAHKLLQELQG